MNVIDSVSLGSSQQSGRPLCATSDRLSMYHHVMLPTSRSLGAENGLPKETEEITESGVMEKQVLPFCHIFPLAQTHIRAIPAFRAPGVTSVSSPCRSTTRNLTRLSSRSFSTYCYTSSRSLAHFKVMHHTEHSSPSPSSVSSILLSAFFCFLGHILYSVPHVFCVPPLELSIIPVISRVANSPTLFLSIR